MLGLSMLVHYVWRVDHYQGRMCACAHVPCSLPQLEWFKGFIMLWCCPSCRSCPRPLPVATLLHLCPAQLRAQATLCFVAYVILCRLPYSPDSLDCDIVCMSCRRQLLQQQRPKPLPRRAPRAGAASPRRHNRRQQGVAVHRRQLLLLHRPCWGSQAS